MKSVFDLEITCRHAPSLSTTPQALTLIVYPSLSPSAAVSKAETKRKKERAHYLTSSVGGAVSAEKKS